MECYWGGAVHNEGGAVAQRTKTMSVQPTLWEGFTREKCDAVHGTGCAGVRG